MSGRTHEINFDGLVGPTHNYAGLARGNLASQQHRHLVSNPRQAALQGLDKMKRLMDLGVGQGVLPPQERPDVGALRRLGFAGSDAEVLAGAARQAPELLAACCSASSMWAANAATVSPSADTADGRVHFTPANLIAHLHRSLEPPTTAAILRAIFRDPAHFVHHEPLPGAFELADEGAANHTRLCAADGRRGLEIFTYGRAGGAEPKPGAAERFVPRQSRMASEAIARRHGLADSHVLFVRQSPEAVDAGVFHNDVIAVGHGTVLVCHERAWTAAASHPDVPSQIARQFEMQTGPPLNVIVIPAEVLPLDEAVNCYLFNSQIVTRPEGGMVLIAPAECAHLARAQRAIELILAAGTPAAAIREILYVDVRQSMQNGGGPACLRLRVELTGEELAACHPGVMLTEGLYGRLRGWVERHYRDRLVPADLADPQLLEESRRALDELSGLLGLGSVYRFQQ